MRHALRLALPIAAWLLCSSGGHSLLYAEGAQPLHDEIDRLVDQRLAGLQNVPAEISSDAEFIRRVSLDLTGMIPTTRQVRSFLDDTSADKRQRLIDDLLIRAEYAVQMAQVFDVMLTERRIPTITSYDVPAAAWRTYLTQAFAENRPWNQFVRGILASDGDGEGNSAGAKFALVRDVAPHQLTRDVGRLFLGIDLQCAQCHDDPRIEAYKQSDYYGIYAFLQRTTSFRDSKKNVSLLGESADGRATFVSVFTAQSGETSPRLPGGEMVADPPLQPGQEYVVKPGPNDRGVPTYSRRMKLAELLPRAETQGFSRNLVNRLWAIFFGRGIVHPVDLHHPGNPPSHPELLSRLEEWFVEHQFDVKALVREIVLSRTYQRSSIRPQGVSDVPANAFAVSPLRGLSPEQFAWSLLQATGQIEPRLVQPDARQPDALQPGTEPMIGDQPPAWKTRLKQLEPLDRSARALSTVFAGLPGQPDGEFQPVVDQALHLLNSPTVLTLVQDAPGTLLVRLTAIADSDSLADELYLSVLSRRPAPDETAEIRNATQSPQTDVERRETLKALIWGLLLSSEFRLNH